MMVRAAGSGVSRPTSRLRLLPIPCTGSLPRTYIQIPLRRLWVRVSAVKVTPSDAPVRSENGREYLLEEESQSELSVGTFAEALHRMPQLIAHKACMLSTCIDESCGSCCHADGFALCYHQIMQKAAEIQEAISEGAVSFLMTEYKYMAVFMVRADLAWPSVGAAARVHVI